MDDFASVEKFDTHIHLNTTDSAFIQQSQSDKFRFLDIVDDRPFGITMNDQEKIARQQVKAFPGRVFYATTFSTSSWGTDSWEKETLAHLDDAFANGATAVKIWKNIGMALRDPDGKFVMVDDARFDNIIDHIAKKNITVVAHLGEPKDCWLPLDQMTIRGNRHYYEEHPEYHMFLHPEYPSYEEQIRARDHMLEKHPDLKFIGAHLGSLEWSLDELAKRLDRFPNMSVDLSRMANLQYHAKKDWQKTRDFFIKYQDRLVYATDRAVNPTQDTESLKQNVHDARLRDWQFFTTDDTMTSSGFDGEFKGLQLPREVVDKIYYGNARGLVSRTLEDEGDGGG
jgi:hypothetical protein